MDEKQPGRPLTTSVVIALGAAFAVLMIFSFGVFVGEQKARFSYGWGRNYRFEFGGPPAPKMLMFGRPRGMFGGHGVAGEVIKKEPTKLLVRSPDNAERVILIDKETHVVKGRQPAGLKDIKEKSRIVVIGSPDDKGRTKARLIRIFDPRDWKESMWRRSNLKPPPPSFL